MSALMQLLDRPIAYQPSFVGLGVGVTGAVLLSQLVYWHNRMDAGWFYKTQKDIRAETGLTREEQETARKRLVSAGVLEEERRGVPAKLYFRVKEDALEALLMKKIKGKSQSAGKPHSSMRESRILERGKAANKNAEIPQASLRESRSPDCGNPADIHTVDYTETTTDIKPSRQDAAQPDVSADEEFISRHPEAVVFSAKKKLWGSADDLKCAEWIWSRIIGMYEQAAESDGEISRPKEPNWTAWANEVRLMCSQDGRTHKQICQLFGRANRDKFWCRNVLSPSKLRERWDDLVIKLAPAAHVETNTAWNTAEGWGETL